MAESKIFPNSHAFVSIFGQEIEEKSEKYIVKVRIVIPLLLILKISRKKLNSENRRKEVEHMAESDYI